jgi:hypothetical protein
MSIGVSVRIFAINTMLLAALLDKSAVAEHYRIHAISEQQATPALQFGPEEQPRSAPERPRARRLSVAEPSVRKQKAVRHERPAGKAAGRGPASAPAGAAVPVDVAGPAHQIPETPDPVAAGVRTVTADELNRLNPAGRPPVQPNGSNTAEAMSTRPGATNKTISAPLPVGVVAPAGQIPETPDPVVAGVRTLAADELSGLNLAAGSPVQPDGSGPAGAGPISRAPAPSGTSSALPVMLGVGPVLVVGFLAWCVRRRAVEDPKARRSPIADNEDFLRDKDSIGVCPAGADMRASPEPRVACRGIGAVGAEIDDVIDLAPSDYDVLSWPHLVPSRKEFDSLIERDGTR